MKIQKVFYQTIKIPLIHPLSHSKRVFKTSESLLFLVKIDDVYGIGECAPRSYVTGETLETAVLFFESFLKKHLAGFSFKNLNEVEGYLDSLFKGNMALRAGVEIAIFDALGNILNKPIYELLFSHSARNTFQINGGVPFFTSKSKTLTLIKQFYYHGVKNFKIKVGLDIKNDLYRLDYIRKEFPDINLRIDANSAWSLKEAIKYLSKMEKYRIYLVEDPLKSDDFRDLKILKKNTNIPIMIDESLITINDALALIELNACSWFNIRLSKNGGFLKSKKILELGKESGIKIQIGSHFGESDILEAARRHFAFGAQDIDAFEGGTIMLFQEHVTKKPLNFDNDLIARIDSINKPGLGVNLKEKYLNYFE